MKSKHLAKADFLRQLRSLTMELYNLGDFTVTDPQRRLHEAKLDGFIDAGLLLKVCHREDMQQLIDACHMDVFKESRTERKKRISEENKATDDGAAITDWDSFDSPAFERSNKQDFSI